MILDDLTKILDEMGGAVPPSSSVTLARAVLRGLWWCVLFLLVWTFSGGKTKFIYVDF